MAFDIQRAPPAPVRTGDRQRSSSRKSVQRRRNRTKFTAPLENALDLEWLKWASEIAGVTAAYTSGRNSCPSSASHVRDRVLWSIRQMALKHREKIVLDDLCVCLGMSRSQYIRAFRAVVGATPYAWLIRLRVYEGTALLLKGESSAEVAFSVGFADQAHFAKHFKRVHGKTPSEITRQYNSQNEPSNVCARTRRQPRSVRRQ